MKIKNPNSVFKCNECNKNDYLRELYVFVDNGSLEGLENWLDQYNESIINDLEITPYIYEDENHEKEVVSKVVLDASIPGKYFNNRVYGPESYI